MRWRLTLVFVFVVVNTWLGWVTDPLTPNLWTDLGLSLVTGIALGVVAFRVGYKLDARRDRKKAWEELGW